MTTMTRHDRLGWIASRDPLSVVALTDEVIDQLGHDSRSCYVETYWLPILGPSAILAARRLGEWLEASPDGIEVPLEVFGGSLGLGGVGRNSPTVRTLARLVDFGMAATGGEVYQVRRVFPPLVARHLERLPGYLAAQHDTLNGLPAAS